ncbi:MAG TPA: hypothetical protein VKQ36_14405, partial [Ktedonobacterales bacterium]|nr:hypothetical protein [Ktedonobacterales bacterium]
PPAEGAAQAAQPHAPHARQSSAPTWRSLPAGNTTIATDDSAPRRQARQIGRAGTVSGTRAGTATGVPSLGLA